MSIPIKRIKRSMYNMTAN